jgi:glutathione synthase
MSVLPAAVDLPIDANVLEDLIQKAKDFALMHGAGMRSKINYNPDVMQVMVP